MALHIAGQPVSLFVLIGILMLFGIVAKNSILLIDFAVEMMNHGMPKNEAIWEAGHKRAQPIVMTTIAMVFGMLPTAVSITGDNSWRAPMGITVIGGLIFSTLLTLRHAGIKPLAIIEENERITARHPGAWLARFGFGIFCITAQLDCFKPRL